MAQWQSINDVLDFAIGEEEAAVEFYMGLARQSDRPELRDALQGFAAEEAAHKRKLLRIKAGGSVPSSADQVPDLKIADYRVEVEPSPDMSYDDLLFVAMQKEKAAAELYTSLAAAFDDGEVRQVLLSMAQEEAKHKLRFETEYDDRLPEG